eukprot:CAMPEP_0182942618 /NCGR_PEP_ID=MMETSP0105_2-20130417/51018_1 /TAXON_ID=81532 ORGANISM="Acanthoeca-like sp., Strain 10tr" /NCGR_SAMPLE_ID=MMETSP0105_2 /ASSEMBLY_ACC=CAM_ASM_000205 /LENGTH=73 /DNA_ID=CAMNT_0025082375 /DNA_START=123 /DNA_END=340 /DNA_ORIENTATION=-
MEAPRRAPGRPDFVWTDTRWMRDRVTGYGPQSWTQLAGIAVGDVLPLPSVDKLAIDSRPAESPSLTLNVAAHT